MYVKIINPKVDGKNQYDNSGSCIPLVKYLSKEDKERERDKEYFFNHDRDHVLSQDVIKAIDGIKGQLMKKDAKFYSLVVAPREDAMSLIKDDKWKFVNYIRDLMSIYAQNFNNKDGTKKGLKGEDLIWFGKIEYNRYYKGNDEEVKKGIVKQGDKKPGDQIHAHIIVGRKDKTNTYKLSPLANDKKQFNRVDFKTKGHKYFDLFYKYAGSGKELEEFLLKKYGPTEERVKYLEHLLEIEKENKNTDSETVKAVEANIKKSLQENKKEPENKEKTKSRKFRM